MIQNTCKLISKTTHKMEHNTTTTLNPQQQLASKCRRGASNSKLIKKDNICLPSKSSTTKSIFTTIAPTVSSTTNKTNTGGRYSNAFVKAVHSSRSLISMGAILIALVVLIVVSSDMANGTSPTQPSNQAEAKGIFKRSFAGLGCLGVYDKAKFARLDRVCEECYQLYREPDIHTACRQDCFRNVVFSRCVDALLLSHEQKKFDEMVDELYGK